MMHVRCHGHILNLVVIDGLKEYHKSISTIRHVVRYVRSSTSRLAKFSEAIEVKHIAFKSLMSLDVSTRWNSTFKMLQAVKKFQKAFESLEDEDRDYLLYFDESK